MGAGSKKSVVFLLWGAGVLLALLVAAAIVAPRLVNTDGVKRRVLAEVERRTGARISYERAEVSVFPRLRVVARGVAFEMAGRAEGKAAIIRADAALLPLLTGTVRIGAVAIDAPVLRVYLPGREGGEGPFSPEEVEERITSVLRALREAAPEAAVSIRNGTVELANATGTVITLRELLVDASFPSGRLTVRLRCSSEYWDTLSVASGLAPEGLRGTTRFETSGLRLDALVERVAPGSVSWLGNTVVSLQGRLDSEGLRAATGDLSGTLPALTVHRNGRSRTVRVKSVNGSVTVAEGGVRAVLKDLSVEGLLRLSGQLSVDRMPPRIEATITGGDLAVAPVRSALLALGDDVPVVAEILDIVRGGDVPRFAVRIAGRSWADLARVDAIAFEARLSRGTILIPGIDLTLLKVSGDASLDRGVLSGRAIHAMVETSRFSHGSFSLGIAQDDPSLRVDVRADAAAGELVRIVRRIFPREAFGEEVARVHDLEGALSGRLVLDGRLSALQATVAVTSARVTGTYPGIPFPIRIEGVRSTFSSRERTLDVWDLHGSVGRSTFSGVSGRAVFAEEPVLSVRSGQGMLDLGELFPWLSGWKSIRDAAKPLRAVRGGVAIGELAIEGPARHPGRWKYDISGDLRDVALETSLAPGPVSAARGRFHLRPQYASLSDVDASLLDATFRGSAEVGWDGDGIRTGAASFDARVGPEFERWAVGRFQVPGAIHVRAPFFVRNGSITWEKGWRASWKGDLGLPAELSVSFSGRAAPGETRMDHAIRDAVSDARLSVATDNGAIRIRYMGILTAGTAEKLVRLPDAGPFRIRGDIELDLERAHPERSAARGNLEVVDLVIPRAVAGPLRIRALSLSGEGRRVRVDSSGLAWDNVPFSMTGSAEFDGKDVVLDAGVTAGDLRLEKVLRSVGAEGAAEGPAPPPAATHFPVRGTVRLDADSLSYGRFSWRPFRAEVRLKEGIRRIGVTDATVCEVSTLGSITLGAGEPAVEISTSSIGKDIDKTVSCLLEKNVAVTGAYDVSLRLEGKGTGGALLHSLRGPLDLELTDGRILKLTLLSRIFGILDLTDLLRGKLPDVEKEGFAYRSLVLRGNIKDGKLSLEEATVDAPSMGIAATGDVDLLGKDTDLKVLVAPFRTVDKIVSWIPGLNYILGGTLVSIPVTVKGDILDPKVTPLSPTAVGEGLLGVMTRTLKLPVKAIDAFGGEKEGTEGQ